MPTTRSTVKKQAKLEDFVDESKLKVGKKPTDTARSSKASSKANPSAKRGKPKESESTPAPKRQKRQHLSPQNVEEPEDHIVINRAPVLQLWAALVAQFLHPKLSWPACLSIGNAISTLCAISKGRAIGMIEPKDETNTSVRKEQKEEAEQESEEFAVMGFPLHLKGDAVLMSGKSKSFNESTLKNKFGEEHYEAAKKVMSSSLQTWSGDKDQLDKKAFHMYESFRPNISAGQQGWGRKGELDLQEVATVIKRNTG